MAYEIQLLGKGYSDLFEKVSHFKLRNDFNWFS